MADCPTFPNQSQRSRSSAIANVRRIANTVYETCAHHHILSLRRWRGSVWFHYSERNSLYQSLLLSTLVYLQYIHVHVQYRSTRSTSLLITFSLLNTLIRIVLSIPHHNHNIIIQQLCMHCCYAFRPAFFNSARRRCQLPAPLPDSSPWVPAWLTGLGVKPCIRFAFVYG